MPPVPELDVNLEEMEKGIPPPKPFIDEDSVVISGMAGMFPMSNHVQGFSKNLYDKTYMVSDKLRFKHNHPELQQFCGIIPELSPFDAQFFGVHARLSITMDSMSRKLLEQTYQAIYDAGLSIDQVRETKLGVFIGSCFSETEKACFYCAENRTGFGIMGCCKAMFANRISYWLDAKGPSMSLDALCASSLVALEHAVQAIRRGDCDAAIVGSSNIILHPQSSILIGRSLQLSPDGKAKSFDKNADGTVRSECVNVLFIQKAKYAKRIYAEVCHVKCVFDAGNRGMFGPIRTIPVLRSFLTEFYEEAKVSPDQVEYIEAYGTAIPEADKNELQAIGEVFCKNRLEPLLVGSIISNMGYSEAATGIASIIKICLGYHTGKFAASLHCENPRDDVEALLEGRMRILTQHTATRYGYGAVNNFSIGGMNSHVLLKGYNNSKDIQRYKSNLPYLVTISGRHEAAVQNIVDDLKSHRLDPEELALLQNIHERSTVGHMARGFCILTTDENSETKVMAEKNDYYADIKRPVWFVYSGMGSQWPTMGAELMRIPIFAAAIERCRKTLEPKGIDIVDIIINPEKTMFDNILHSFVGIAAIQIGLTDILTELGIVPDKIIGHSVGELGCAYADGCFTAEEMILSAYSRGLVSVQTPFIHGSMAAVGLGYTTVTKMCPPEIEVACHNSSESSTISGPSDVMKEFVGKLTAQGVFAKEVPCSNIAYHSRYIAEAGPKLQEYLSEVIKEPKARSDKWVSTSVPYDKWNQESAKYSSAEYHTNNLLNPVLFEETARMIPANAVTIEIAPHGLLQAIIKKSLPSGCTNVPLTRRGHSDPVTFLLNALGQLYMAGLNLKLLVLYPKIEFPISTGTGLLSHMIKWVHTEKWPLPIYASANRSTAALRNFLISIFDEDYKYIEGCVIDGQVVFPLSAILVFVWETLAMAMNENKNSMSLHFADVQTYNDAVVHPDHLVKLCVSFQRGSGRFEVTKENNLVVTGILSYNTSPPEADQTDQEVVEQETVTYHLDVSDIYKIFFRKGYFYKNKFRSIRKASFNFTEAELAWDNDWVIFLDSILQLDVLARDKNAISKATFIKKIVIDNSVHEQCVAKLKNNALKAHVDTNINVTNCGGVTIEGIRYVDKLPTWQPTILKKYEFMPFNTIGLLDIITVLHAHFQIVTENTKADVIKAVEITNDNFDISIGDLLKTIAYELIGVKLASKRATEKMLNENEELPQANLVVGYDIIDNTEVFETLKTTLPNNTFVLTLNKADTTIEEKGVFTIIASATTSHGRLILLKWHPLPEKSNVICLSVDNDCPLLRYTKDNLKFNDRLIITSKYPAEPALKDLMRKWSKENEKIQLYLTDERMVSDQQFFEGSKRNLTYNILKNNVWGSEFYLPIGNQKELIDYVKLTNVPGSLDSLKWTEVPEITTNALKVKVHYAGPNSRDVEKAVGQVPNNANYSYGMDFSGVTQGGVKVMGVIREGALTTIVDADPQLLWPVPQHWSLEDAATVPLPYLQAFYCLAMKGSLRYGHSILIHSGTGALGQAAISLALGLGCKVFTTVSTIPKKKFLMKIFPQLTDENIGNSRDNTFETMIQCGTNGEGCDIVISNLKGELREASMRCVGRLGKLIDVSVHDILNNAAFKMFFLTLERAYVPVTLDSIFEEQNIDDKTKLQHMVSEGIRNGYVRPLSRVTFAPSEVTRAFRLLATSSHRGRVLLRLHELASVNATPRIHCSDKHSYIVLCGKNEFGIDVAERLVIRGAKFLMLHCDIALDTGLFRKKINSWRDLGVKVLINIEALDVNNNHVKLVSKATGMGPVEGVIIVDKYNKTILDGFDKITRKVCPQLKYFAVLRTEVEGFKSFEYNILNNRNEHNLNTLLLHYPTLHKFDEDKDDNKVGNKIVAQNINGALNAIEIGLRFKQNLPISCYTADNNAIDIVKDLSLILGINLTDKIPANTTLRDFGVDLDKCEKIGKYFDRTLKLSFDREDIPDFTIAKLQHLAEPKFNNTDTKIRLSTYFTKVDPEELDSTLSMVIMPSLVISSFQRYDEFDANETYLVIIPGLEGHFAQFGRISERLRIPTVVLQPALEYANDSVEEIAARLIKIMKKNMNLNNKKFYILGYSFGTLIALEMASILEDQGIDGTVYCLDSAPGVFQRQLYIAIGNMTEAELQNATAEHMFTLMAHDGFDDLKEELKEAHTWKEKVDMSMRHLCGRVPHSVQYARLLIEAAYGRICAARKYNSERLVARPLRSQIVLLKGQVPSELSDLPHDFGLSYYTQSKPIVYELDCDHISVPQDLHCSNIINCHLGDDIHEQFLQRNLCETYLDNPSKFIGVAD